MLRELTLDLKRSINWVLPFPFRGNLPGRKRREPNTRESHAAHGRQEELNCLLSPRATAHRSRPAPDERSHRYAARRPTPSPPWYPRQRAQAGRRPRREPRDCTTAWGGVTDTGQLLQANKDRSEGKGLSKCPCTDGWGSTRGPAPRLSAQITPPRLSGRHILVISCRVLSLTRIPHILVFLRVCFSFFPVLSHYD